MNSTYKRVIDFYNQMNCPYCGRELNVSLQTAENEVSGIVIPHSSCCEKGSQYVAETFKLVYQQALSEECAAILNIP